MHMYQVLYVYVYIYIYIHAHTCMHDILMCVYINIYIYIYIYTYVYTHTHSYMYIYILYVYVCIYTQYTCIHMYVCNVCIYIYIYNIDAHTIYIRTLSPQSRTRINTFIHVQLGCIYILERLCDRASPIQLDLAQLHTQFLIRLDLSKSIINGAIVLVPPPEDCKLELGNQCAVHLQPPYTDDHPCFVIHMWPFVP